MNIIEKKWTGILVASTVLLSLDTSHAIQPKMLVKGSVCNVEVGNVHISDTILKRENRLAVKANGVVSCDVMVQKLSLRVQIWKKGTGFNHLVADKTITQSKVLPRRRNFKNQETYAYCQNPIWTDYFAKVKATWILGGIHMETFWKSSDETLPICCGT